MKFEVEGKREVIQEEGCDLNKAKTSLEKNVESRRCKQLELWVVLASWYHSLDLGHSLSIIPRDGNNK